MAAPAGPTKKPSWEALLEFEILWGGYHGALGFLDWDKDVAWCLSGGEDDELAKAAPFKFAIKRHLPKEVPYVDLPEDKMGPLFKKAVENSIQRSANNMIFERQQTAKFNAPKGVDFVVVENDRSISAKEISKLREWMQNPSLLPFDADAYFCKRCEILARQKESI